MKYMVIGNGFDLSLGLKTSYGHFMESCEFKSLIDDKNTLAIHLANEVDRLKNWVDIENELYKWTQSINTSNRIELIRDDYSNLKNELNNYLERAQKEEINKDSHAYKMLKKNLDHSDITIYNFNYTNSIQNIIEDTYGFNPKNVDHVYVHGSVNGSNIIFGVEDKIKLDEGLIFLKKSFSLNYGSNYRGSFFGSIFEEHKYLFFGHSLGKTDSTYFNNFFSSMGREKTHSKFAFYYYEDIGYVTWSNI